jgi:hypothetical protein
MGFGPTTFCMASGWQEVGGLPPRFERRGCPVGSAGYWTTLSRLKAVLVEPTILVVSSTKIFRATASFVR